MSKFCLKRERERERDRQTETETEREIKERVFLELYFVRLGT